MGARYVLCVLSFKVLAKYWTVMSTITFSWQGKAISRVLWKGTHEALKCSPEIWGRCGRRIRSQSFVRITWGRQNWFDDKQCCIYLSVGSCLDLKRLSWSAYYKFHKFQNLAQNQDKLYQVEWQSDQTPDPHNHWLESSTKIQPGQIVSYSSLDLHISFSPE